MRWLGVVLVGCGEAGETADDVVDDTGEGGGTTPAPFVIDHVRVECGVVRTYSLPPEPLIDGTVFAVDTRTPDTRSEEHILTDIGPEEFGMAEAGLAESRWSCQQWSNSLTLIVRLYEYDLEQAPTGRMDCLAIGHDPAGLVAGDYSYFPDPSHWREIDGCRVE